MAPPAMMYQRLDCSILSDKSDMLLHYLVACIVDPGVGAPWWGEAPSGSVCQHQLLHAISDK